MNPRTSQSKEPTLTTIVTLLTQLDKKIEDIGETVEFLKDNVPMRDEVAMKEDLAEFKSDVTGHIDHIVQLHKKQEVELVAVAHRMTRHEEVFHGKQ